MACSVSIKKNMGSFSLDMQFQTEAKRLGILGESGAGKSMCLKAIAGILKPDEGEIYIGENCVFSKERKLNLPPQKRKVGYLFQSYALFPHMSVWENLSVSLRGSKEEKEEKISSILEKMELKGMEKRLPGRLSGGQQQRAALARILVGEPEIILLDEPFSALDFSLRDRMQEELMRHLEDFQGSCIMVSHSRDELYRFSEELLIVEKGRILCQGETKSLFRNPRKRAAAALTGCKNISQAEKRGEHRIFASDWGIELQFDKEIPDGLSSVGYRAHDFTPLFSEEERGTNCIPVHLESIAEYPFEKNFYFRAKEGRGRIVFMEQRESFAKWEQLGTPKYLKVDTEKLLLLED